MAWNLPKFMLLTYKVGHVYEVGIVLNRQY